MLREVTAKSKIRRSPILSKKNQDFFYKRLLAQVFRGRTLGFLSIFIIWQVASMISREGTLVSPFSVFRDVFLYVILDKKFFIHTGSTLLRIIIGFGISFIIGVTIGVIMGINKYWEKVFSDYVTIGITIPTLSWAVIGVLWFGIHYLTPVFSAVMIATPYVTVNIWEGVKNVDKDLVDMGRAFDVSRLRIIRYVHIHSMLPFVFAAVRLGFSVSWKLVILAEVFGSSEGIGYMIFYWFEHFEMSLVLAWVMTFCFVMFIYEYGVIRTLERRLFAWRPKAVL